MQKVTAGSSDGDGGPEQGACFILSAWVLMVRGASSTCPNAGAVAKLTYGRRAWSGEILI